MYCVRNIITVMIFFVACLFLPMKANAKQQQVLVIHSYHAEHKWTGFLKEGFDDALGAYPDVQLFHEYMDAKRNPKPTYKKLFYDYLIKKYSVYDLDAIVITDDPAMNFIKEYRSDLFASVPIVFAGINRVTGEILNAKGITGVFENRDLVQTVIDIKAFTGKDEIVVVTDPSSTGEANRIKLAAVKDNPKAPQIIHYINKLNDSDIHRAFSGYDSDIPVLLIGQIIDTKKNNALMTWTGGSDILTRQIPNPVFTIGIITLDYGAVGGHELNGQSHAKRAAGLLIQILNGTSVDQIPEITIAKSQWYFNWQNVKQHKLENHKFPAQSQFIHLDKSFYEQNKTMVHVIIAFFVVAILVILLLIEIIRRGYNTRKILMENETRYRDLAHSGASIFWETDIDNKFSYISGRTEQVFGVIDKEMLGNEFSLYMKNNPRITFPWKEFNDALKNEKSLENLIFKVTTQDEKQKIVLINGKPIYDLKGLFVGYRGITKEITEEYLLSEQVAYQASHDSLTGLINRSSFNLKLKELVDYKKDTQDVFVCFLDLDNFKIVNDTVGHLIGDVMLSEIANVIENCIGVHDVLGRLGGDEFGLILFNYTKAEVQQVCDDIIDGVQKYKLQWQDKYFSVGVSIGVVPYTQKLNQVELLSKADLACYQAKDLGKGRVYITGENDEQLYSEELQLGYISSVAQAIEQDRFFLAKQMISPTSDTTNSSKHYEILIRYRDEKGDLIPPGLFIPAAEKHGLIILIDKWVVKTVFERYQEFFPKMDTMLSINLSGVSFGNQDFVDHLAREVQLSSIDPKNICFEITETAVISQINQAQEFIQRMKQFGYKFALDDFGSGASSFGYLKQLPVDYLKIDGSLVRNIVTEPTDKAIVESINSIAHMMGMETIAEFVENDDIRNVLEEVGVDYVQGYGVHKPEKC